MTWLLGDQGGPCRRPSKATKSFSRVNTTLRMCSLHVGHADREVAHPLQLGHHPLGLVSTAPERRIRGQKGRWTWRQVTPVSDLALLLYSLDKLLII